MSSIGQEKFLILKQIKIIVLKCDTLLLNIPKADLDYKFKLRDSLENAYKLVVRMNYTENKNDFDKLYTKLLAEISYYNFALEIIYDKKYINSKNLNDLVKHVNDFNKMLYVWHQNKMEIENAS